MRKKAKANGCCRFAANFCSKLERFLRYPADARFSVCNSYFFHLQQDASSLTLGRVQAGQDVEHWFELLRIQFERINLPAPVIAIRLRGGQGQLATMGTGALSFSDAASSRDTSIACLVERLSARMGEASVHGVAAVAEHRPQNAWRRSPLLGDAPHCAAATTFDYWNERDMPQLLHTFQRTGSLLLRRPLWMLDTPEVLAVKQELPVYRGTLTLLDGPERLESGWWDDEGIARDYFVARTDDGVHVWVYRDRRASAAWYLHGIFG